MSGVSVISDRWSGGGLPGGNHVVELLRVGRGLQALAQLTVAEQLGNLGEDFQMLLGGRFGHQQEDQQIDGLFIRGVKTDGVPSWKTAAMGLSGL